MIWLDIDPNLVKPGYLPLLITLGLALVLGFLYRSMRKQVGRIDPNLPHEQFHGSTMRIQPRDSAEPPAPPTGQSTPTDLR
ncbi:MAG: hypothetical protein ACR2I1_08160 [Propionibacteriaceae bacterium]